MSTPTTTTTVASPTSAGRAVGRRWPRRRLKGGRAAMWAGVTILVVLVVLSIAVPLAATSATTAHPADSLLSPSWSHIFGTDRYGRDVFVRCMAAMHIDLLLAFVVAAAAFTVGSVIGSISGLAGRYVDEVIMRLTDILMAFPAFVLALVITACLGNSTVHAVIGITVAYTPYFIRLTRSRALSVRTLDYVAAARLAGTRGLRLAIRHVMPNSIQPALVQATLVAAWGILDIAGLSFLGVGVQPPTPEWGAMIADGYSDILSGQWWTALFPGVLILVTAAAFHLIGDTLDGDA